MGLNKPQPLKDKIRYAEDYYTISLSSICAKQNIGGMFEIEDVANAVKFLKQEVRSNGSILGVLSKLDVLDLIDKAFPDVGGRIRLKKGIYL